MKENRMKIIITSLITLAPILLGVLFWDRLPDRLQHILDKEMCRMDGAVSL